MTPHLGPDHLGPDHLGPDPAARGTEPQRKMQPIPRAWRTGGRVEAAVGTRPAHPPAVHPTGPRRRAPVVGPGRRLETHGTAPAVDTTGPLPDGGSGGPERGGRRSGWAAREPELVAIDVGSAHTGVWAPSHGVLRVPSRAPGREGPIRVVTRGRILDRAGCTAMLARLVRHYVPPLRHDPVVAACVPVRSTATGRAILTEVLAAATNARSIMLIDSVYAAAIGAGVPGGTALILDVGAQLTELAVVNAGAVLVARRAEVGTEDLGGLAGPDTIIAVVATILDDVSRHTPDEHLCAARRGGIRLVGGGALLPGLAPALAGALDLPVYMAARPATVALRGAGLAALAALSDPAASGPAYP